MNYENDTYDKTSTIELSERVEVVLAGTLLPRLGSKLRAHRSSGLLAGHRPNLRGHSTTSRRSGFLCTLFEPKRGVLFAGSADGHIHAWRGQTAEARGRTQASQRLEGHRGAVRCLAYSTSYRLLISGSADRSIKIWDPWKSAHASTIVQSLAHHTGGVTEVTTCVNLLFSAGTDGGVVVWGAVEGRDHLLYPWFDVLCTVSCDARWVTALAYSPESGGVLYAGDETGNVHLFTPQGIGARPTAFHKLCDPVRAHELGVTLIVFSVRDNAVVTAGNDGAVVSWDLHLRNVQARFAGRIRVRVRSVVYDEGSSTLILLSEDGRVEMWGAISERRVADVRVTAHSEAVSLFAVPNMSYEERVAQKARASGQLQDDLLSQDSRIHQEISGDHVRYGKKVQAPAVVSGRESPAVSIPAHSRAEEPLVKPVTRIGVATPSDIRLYTIERTVDVADFRGHSDTIISLLALIDDKDSDSALVEQERILPTPVQIVSSDGETPNGSSAGEMRIVRLWSVSYDNSLRSWDPLDMSNIQTIHEASGEVSCAALYPEASPGGATALVTGNDDGSIRVWNTDAESCTTRSAHTNTVTCLCLAQTMVNNTRSLYLVSGSYDGTVAVWYMMKQQRHFVPQREAVLPAPTPGCQERKASGYEVLSIAFAERHGVLAVGRHGGALELWNLEKRMLLGVHKAHAESVLCLAVDENILFSGGSEGIIVLWDLVGMAELSSFRAHSGSITSLSVANVPIFAEKNAECDDPQAAASPQAAGLLPALITTGADGRVALWDVAADMMLQEYCHSAPVRCAAVLFREARVYIGTDDARIISFPLRIPDVRSAERESLSGSAASQISSTPAPTRIMSEEDVQQWIGELDFDAA